MARRADRLVSIAVRHPQRSLSGSREVGATFGTTFEPGRRGFRPEMHAQAATAHFKRGMSFTRVCLGVRSGELEMAHAGCMR